MKLSKLVIFGALVFGASALLATLAGASGAPRNVVPLGQSLDVKLGRVLDRASFRGRMGETLEARLGRPVDPKLAHLGNLLFFDRILGLHGDNACAGCHSPSNGFGDTQSIAIGIQSNQVVGPHRSGPRNQRRTPMVLNNAFFPKLMWNGRFRSAAGDPFDNSQGFTFPPPEGTARFTPGDPRIRHLLVAQAHIPPTEQIEVAGFTGAGGPFDDGLGHPVPEPDASGFRNEPIRQAVLALLNASPLYRAEFGALFPEVAEGGPIDFAMLGQAIAEFEFTLTFADAPIDRFARGEHEAMTDAQKRGALLFFGRAGCVKCHAVAGGSNEMFSDFEMRVAGVPQIAPEFGTGKGNFAFLGPAADEDFGLEDITADPNDRYKFRTSPLRNVALQAAFFHNGSFTRLEDALRHHLNPEVTARLYDPFAAGLDLDLALRPCPIDEVLERLDPLLQSPAPLSDDEFQDLLAFVRDGLLDERAAPSHLEKLIPDSVPSGLPLLFFERKAQ
jgi:cytochrome c peroxidase